MKPWYCTIVKDKTDGTLQVNVYGKRRQCGSDIAKAIGQVRVPTQAKRVRIRVIGADDGAHSCVWLSVRYRGYPGIGDDTPRPFQHIGYYKPDHALELARTYLQMLP